MKDRNQNRENNKKSNNVKSEINEFVLEVWVHPISQVQQGSLGGIYSATGTTGKGEAQSVKEGQSGVVRGICLDPGAVNITAQWLDTFEALKSRSGLVGWQARAEWRPSRCRPWVPGTSRPKGSDA